MPWPKEEYITVEGKQPIPIGNDAFYPMAI